MKIRAPWLFSNVCEGISGPYLKITLGLFGTIFQKIRFLKFCLYVVIGVFQANSPDIWDIYFLCNTFEINLLETNCS